MNKNRKYRISQDTNKNRQDNNKQYMSKNKQESKGVDKT